MYTYVRMKKEQREGDFFFYTCSNAKKFLHFGCCKEGKEHVLELILSLLVQ